MKTVFVTGASSFIGVNLIRELLNNNYQVVAIIRKKTDNLDRLKEFKKIKIIELDMNEIEKLLKLINTKCDIFYHLAWNGTRGSDRYDREMQKENYNNSVKVFNTAISLGCKTFISAGSQAEYGICDKIITEKTKEEPVTEYGKYKLKFCNYCKRVSKEKNIIFIEPRFFSLYGTLDYENSLINYLIRNMLKNERLLLTECTQKWNYLNVRDAVRALVMLQNTKNGGVYNIASNDTRLLKEFVMEIYTLTKSKSELHFSMPYSIEGKINIEPSINKLVNETGWEPRITFHEGIEEIIEESELYEKNKCFNSNIQ